MSGPLPPRMVPSLFIMVVPPSIVGLDLLLMGVALPWIWCVWGIAAFFLALAMTQNQYPAQPALWHATLGHELSDGSIHHPQLAISLRSQLQVAGAP